MSAQPVERIPRFCKTTRWFHWTFALSFLALAVSGAALALRETLGMDPETGEALLRAHEIVGVVWLTAPWLVAASGDTDRWLADLEQVTRFGPHDLAWLRAQALPWRKLPLPEQDKLNAGQKLNALAVIALSVVLATTGIHLWRAPGAFVALGLHLGAFLAWLPAFGVHLFMALLNPATRPALRGMVRGEVSRAWARHHHRRWVESEERR